MSALVGAVKLLSNPDVDKVVLIKFIFRQIKAQIRVLGYRKVASILLGLLMVGVSSFIKIPQIRKILKPPTADQRIRLAEGLSKDSVRLETLAQFIHVTFNKQQGNAFLNYGESLLLGIQNIGLLAILEYYRMRKELREWSSLPKDAQQKEALKATIKPIAGVIAAVIFLTKIAPKPLIAALQVLIIPIGIAAKIPQIRRNEEIKSTAHLSEVTIGANVIGSLIRVYTTLTNFKPGKRDSVLLAGYLTSFALNAVLAGQIYKYGKTDKKD
ncbi:CIC11C00000001883 [Sungouiella intermedia]|uniref:Solute carrier family 66 member 3 n=1 Tax=Sungouiella intermedia TaxID=45354 RepID=A0A1L0BWW2_9ASCO|nr:CIC11C00000001883 [[Candida] intermedia]